jgi:hypothetical protein
MNMQPEWVTGIAAAIQAIATIVLVIVTRAYVKQIRQQVEQEQQHWVTDRNSSAEREKGEMERAVQALAVELVLNKSLLGRAEGLLLNSAYTSCLWALPRLGVSLMTLQAVGRAYADIVWHNLAYERLPELRGSLSLAKREVQNTVPQALDALSQDPATKRMIQFSEALNISDGKTTAAS